MSSTGVPPSSRIRTGHGAGSGSRSRACANRAALRGSGRGLVPAGATGRLVDRIASPGTHSRSQTRYETLALSGTGPAPRLSGAVSGTVSSTSPS